jgi:hypothetical protein
VPLWKKILLRSAGFGAGFALTLCLIVGVWVWYQGRPQPPVPWNKQAVIAEYDRVDTRGTDNHIVFLYTLQNNTDEDFRVDAQYEASLSEKLQKQKEFAQFSQDFYTLEYPVFVPAKSRVQLAIDSKHVYPSQIKTDATAENRKEYRDTLAHYVTDKYPNLDGFVLFATLRRFEIDFPTGWEKTAKASIPDEKK